jgi:hypothetical protein
MSEHRWSKEVTQHDRHDVEAGVFAGGDARTIADAVWDAALAEGSVDTTYRRAMEKVTFYENRAGKNLSSERRQTLEEVKNLLHARNASLE